MGKFDLDQRLVDFAAAVGRIIGQIPGTRLGSHVAGQLVRCGTAPAAHYAEAQGAESRRDFIHKVRLALKELRESLSWLRLAGRMSLASNQDVEAAVREGNELIAIMYASIKTATSNLEKQRMPNGE